MEKSLLRLNAKYNCTWEKKPHSICNLKNGANTKEHKFPAGLLQI